MVTSYQVRLENEKVRVLEYRDQPGERTRQHAHPNFLLLAVAPFKRKLILPDSRELTREFKVGEIMWQPAQTHIGENIGQTPTHVIMMELK